MIIQDVFKVLYSPLKAFEKLTETPDVKGPFIILLIVLLASASFESVKYSKILLETEKDGGEYIPLTTSELFGDLAISALIDSMFGFFLTWIIYGGMFLIVLKLFRTEQVPWRKLFVLVGYTLIVAAIFVVVRTILFATLPTLYFKYETWTDAFLEMKREAQDLVLQKTAQTWVPSLAYQIGSYLSIAAEVWTAALGAVAVHLLCKASWNKALIISAIVSTVSFVMRFPLVFFGI